MTHTSTHTIDELIRTNREAFRAQATAALKQFSTDDRELAASMATSYASVDDVLKAWTEQIEPMYRDLEHKRNDARFRKSLVRHIGFHDNDAGRMIDFMIEERKQSLLDEVLDNVYHSDIEETPYQREYAVNLLSQPTGEIEDYKQRYQRYIEAIEAAERHHIILCDPHGSWLERQRTALAINKERQRLAQDEEARLETITTQLDHLLTGNQLLKQIINKRINIILLLDLTTKYQKQLDALSNDERDDPVTRLKLFERVTSDFREREIERIATSHHIHTLRTLSVLQADISAMLLEVFDLSPAQRNRLLLDTQKHTRLIQEHDLILLIQRNREHFFVEHD